MREVEMHIILLILSVVSFLEPVCQGKVIYMNNCEQRFISSDYLIPCTTGLEAVKPEASGSPTSTLNRHRHLNLYSCP